MNPTSEVPHLKSKKLVVGLVLVGLLVLTATVIFVLRRRFPGSLPGSASPAAETQKWCEIRREWAKKVNGLAADIALKSVREEDRSAKAELESQRAALCAEYAAKIRGLGLSDPAIIQVERALVKEGKVRANVAVELSNLRTKLAAGELDNVAYGGIVERMQVMREAMERLQGAMKSRISEGRAAADAEVKQALQAVGGCAGLYRGPMTDEGTADSPYRSWDELELYRQEAVTAFKDITRLLEPREQFANHVYHELVRKYRSDLKRCYSRVGGGDTKKVDLQVRLKRGGQIQSLAVTSGKQKDIKILDCLLARASRWKLPAPAAAGEAILVTVDFAHI